MSRWHRTEFDLLPEQAFQPRPGGGMTLEGGGGGKVDNSAQNYAAMQQAALSAEQLAWAKEIYASEAPQRAAASEMGNAVSQAQLDQMRQQTQIAAQGQQDYEQIYRPNEQRLAAEAAAYDTPERRAAEAAAASAQVEQQIAAQRGASMRDLERSGVNPASGKVAAIQGSMDLGAAKLKAGASTAAAKNVETVGRAMRSDVANLGRGIASSQATNAALASNLGTSAVNTTGTVMNNNANAAQGVRQAYGTAINGFGSAGSTFGSIAAQQQQAATKKSNDTAAGVGAAMSIAGMFL